VRGGLAEARVAIGEVWGEVGVESPCAEDLAEARVAIGEVWGEVGVEEVRARRPGRSTGRDRRNPVAKPGWRSVRGGEVEALREG
jgi:hypothetical protein